MMREQARKFLRRFYGDESGNIFILFGLAVIPLLVIMGGAVDLGRYNHYKMKLSNAVDAAGLALVRKEQERGETFSDAEAKQFVIDYVNAFGVTDDTFHVQPSDYVVTRTDSGYQVAVAGTVDNLFLPLAELSRVEKNLDTIDIGIDAEFVRSAQNIELAMVLDVTGSMAGSKITDLKDAAKGLIDIIVKPPEKQNFYYSKVAIVPYSMGVNVGSNAATARGAVEPGTGISNAYWLTGSAKSVSSVTNDYPAQVRANSHGFQNGDLVHFSGVQNMSGLSDDAFVVADRSRDYFRLKDSRGWYVNGRDYGWRDGYGGTVSKCAETNCDVVVEANGHGFETGDHVYITGVGGLTNINNKPFEAARIDSNKIRLKGSGPGNNAYTSGGKVWCGEVGCKYRVFHNVYGSLVGQEVSTCVSERTGAQAYTDASPSTAKAGYAYPSPDNPCLANEIMPLTSSIPDLKAKVNTLSAQGSTAGQIGVGWGWYMVSPNWASLWPNAANKAAAYGTPETLKVVVLMTDGAFNTPYCSGVVAADAGSGSGSGSYHINCDATNGDPFAQAKSMCTAMKNRGIIVYTVGFDVGSEWQAQDVMTSCATSEDHVYFPEDGVALKDAFRAIAEDVDQLRIAR